MMKNKYVSILNVGLDCAMVDCGPNLKNVKIVEQVKGLHFIDIASEGTKCSQNLVPWQLQQCRSFPYALPSFKIANVGSGR